MEGPAGAPWGCGLWPWFIAVGQSLWQQAFRGSVCLASCRWTRPGWRAAVVLSRGFCGGRWQCLFLHRGAVSGLEPVLSGDWEAAGIGAPVPLMELWPGYLETAHSAYLTSGAAWAQGPLDSGQARPWHPQHRASKNSCSPTKLSQLWHSLYFHCYCY